MFPFNMRYEILEAMAPLTREFRPVPIIFLALEGLRYSDPENGLAGSIGVRNDWYRFVRISGLVPEEAVQHVRAFFEEKRPPASLPAFPRPVDFKPGVRYNIFTDRSPRRGFLIQKRL